MCLDHRASSLEAERESRSGLTEELLLQTIPAHVENASRHQNGSKPFSGLLDARALRPGLTRPRKPCSVCGTARGLLLQEYTEVCLKIKKETVQKISRKLFAKRAEGSRTSSPRFPGQGQAPGTTLLCLPWGCGTPSSPPHRSHLRPDS